MLDITRNGIYNNLDISTYYHTVEGITYYFSSKQYRDKFISLLEVNRLELNFTVAKKLKIDLNANQIYDMLLYQRIEKRGFRATYGGVELWPNTIEYVGGIQTKKNLDEL